MPNPSPTTTLQRADLSELAWEYMLEASQRGFIGTAVMPTFNVTEQSADYPVIRLDQLLKAPETKRAPRANYARGDWVFGTNTYACQEYGWEEPLDDVEARLYERYLDAEEVSVEIAVDVILRGHEKRVADAVANPANAGSNNAAAANWTDQANATPFNDVKNGKQAMRDASGLMPNAAVMSLRTLEDVLATDELRNYLQYTSPHLVEGLDAQRNTLARYFGVEQVIVGDAIEDTAKRGQAANLGDIWSGAVVNLMRVSGGEQRLREPVFGRTFVWTRDAPSAAVTEQYREEQTRSNIYRVRQHVDEAIVYTGANHQITGIR